MCLIHSISVSSVSKSPASSQLLLILCCKYAINVSCACACGRPAGLSASILQSAADATLVFQQLLMSAALPDCLQDAKRSQPQPCMTAYCLFHNTYDPGISPGAANQCILGDMYLTSILPRKRLLLSVQGVNTALPWYKKCRFVAG